MNHLKFLSLIFLIQYFISNFCVANIGVCIDGFSVENYASNSWICNKDSLGLKRAASELDCVFPFKLNNGSSYYTCIQTNEIDGFWCSLDKKFNKRMAKCRQECPKLANVDDENSIHSSCLHAEAGVKSYLPDNSDKKKIIGLHNLIRSRVTPLASNMRGVFWDNDLAFTAMKWAENISVYKFQHDCHKCRLNINDKETHFGQNAYMSIGFEFDSKLWTRSVKSWFREIRFFKYGKKNSYRVGHYTQIIYAPVTRVGCGAAEYSAKKIVTIVCNYATIQHTFSKPYDVGSTCSNCKKENCVNKLCYCNKICQNYGKLDLENCTCSCPPYVTGKECEIKLCDKTDSDYGCWGDNEKYCHYSNTHKLCPHLCGMCDYNY